MSYAYEGIWELDRTIILCSPLLDTLSNDLAHGGICRNCLPWSHSEMHVIVLVADRCDGSVTFSKFWLYRID